MIHVVVLRECSSNLSILYRLMRLGTAAVENYQAMPKQIFQFMGQESNYTTWRLAKINLAIRGIEGQIAHGDSFHNDCHPDLKADFILANPPFNVSDWGAERTR